MKSSFHWSWGRTRLCTLDGTFLLSETVAPERSIFLCVHKHSEALAETFRTESLKLSVGHWGAIDGKNDWKDCDVAVIFGLPYMDQRRAINNLFATHGPQDTEWLQRNAHKQHATILNVIMQRHLSTSVVQAINRICCRRVIDEQGRLCRLRRRGSMRFDITKWFFVFSRLN